MNLHPISIHLILLQRIVEKIIMSTRKSTPKCPVGSLQNLKIPISGRMIYLKIYESKYTGMLTNKLLKQIQWSEVRLEKQRQSSFRRLDVLMRQADILKAMGFFKFAMEDIEEIMSLNRGKSVRGHEPQMTVSSENRP